MHKQEQSQKQIVLTGYIGSGKTTLFNLICKTTQPVKSGGISLTRQTFLKESAYGSGFRVLDTPGYASKSDKIIHAVGVLNALSEGPVNQIFLIVKWDRKEFMQDFIQNMVVKFRRFKRLLTVAVTHWDTVDKQTIKEDKQQIFNLCQSFGINSVIFISKYDSGEKVCSQIDSILNHSQAENVLLTEAEFYSNFDLVELKSEVDLELEGQKADVEVKFKKLAAAIKLFIIKFDENNPSICEVMHYLALETKRLAEKTIEEFEIKNSDKFSQLFEYHNNPHLAYLVHSELKKSLMNTISDIIQLTQTKMISHKNHFFNFIKACPFCETIWLKVAGCGGQTTCGEFPISDEYFNNYKMPQKYEFNITENGITYKIDEKYQKMKRDLSEQKKSKNNIWSFFQNKSTSSEHIYKIPEKKQRIGCGKPIVWDQIPPLSNKLFNELIDPGLMDYFIQDVPNEELQKTLIKAYKSVKDQVEQIKKENKVVKL